MPHVRPILIRIRKSVFDIISPKMKGCRFLDLFAGMGTVGIEALSRSASSAVFVEMDGRCVKLIRDNLKIFSFEDRGRVFQMNVLKNMPFLPGPFDLIFMGPPYKDEEKNPLKLVAPTLENIDKNNLLAQDGWIIAQHHKKEEMKDVETRFEMFRQEKYGDSFVSFFKAPGESA